MEHKLANSVFRFFRYENNGGDSLLDNNTFKFQDLFDNTKVLEKDIHTLITSLEQVGKTFLTLPVSIIYLAFGYPIVYLVMDKNQKKQVHRRLVKIMDTLYEHLKLEGYKDPEIQRFDSDTIIYYDSMNKFKGDELEESLNGTSPRFIFTIKEHTQIERINKYLNKKFPIVLVLDEVHKTGAYKKEGDVYHNENVHYDESIVNLKQYAKKIINVSATAQDLMMVSNLYSDNILYINPGEHHNGIKDWVWDTKFSTKKDKKYDVMPQSVLGVLEKISDEEVIVRHDRKNNKIDTHPHVVLCKYHRKLEMQKEMLEWFQKSNESFTKKWTIIVYQGEGISLYYNSIGNIPIDIYTEDDVFQRSVFRDNTHYFNSNHKNSISITDCLQYLAERGTVLHPKILIIGFDMCCEGISYASHYNKTHNWHLTAEIAKFPGNCTASLQKQVLSRVNGNHGDDIKPRIYVDQKIKEKVLYSYEMCEKQIHKCIELSQTGNIKICKDHLDNMEHFKNRVPNNHYKIKTITTNTVENPNSKKERKVMKNTSESIDILYSFDPIKYEKIKETIHKIESDSIIEKNKMKYTPIITTTTTTTITITKTVSIPIKTNDEQYYLIEPEKLKMGSSQFLIVDESINQIINNKEVGNTILRSTLNKWLLALNNPGIVDVNHINGNFDIGIVPKMTKVSSIETKGLLYWKNNSRFYVRLNV